MSTAIENYESTFNSWRLLCLDLDSDPSIESLMSLSRNFFQEKSSIPGANPDQVLAQLVYSLGPALQSDHSSCIVRALTLIQGSVVGTSLGDSNKGLQAETMELLESYLLGQCSCSSTVDGAVSEVIIAAIGCVEDLIKCHRLSSINDYCNVIRIAQSAVESAGISSLMRAGRSACFSLLTSTIELAPDIIHDKPNEEIFRDSNKGLMKGYVSFCASCLDGEKDPRCLLAALRLLSLCINLFPSELICFEDLFEYACVYYPISFTPPPNDPYKITKDDLRDNLFNVICDSRIPATSIVSLFRSHLEAQDDLEEDFRNDDICLNKVDVLTDLMNWFNQRSNNDGFNETLVELSTELEELARTLIQIHHWVFRTAPTELMNATEEKTNPPILLADKILQTASTISAISEKNHNIWSKFCEASIISLASSVSDAPESIRGRSALSFLVSLAKSGTSAHRLCVKEATPQLINIIRSATSLHKNQNQSMIDNERLVAVLHALGSLMRVDNDSIVNFHPDPLVQCSNEVLPLLVTIAFEFIDDSSTNGSYKLFESSAASVYALSSIISMNTPEESETKRIINMVIDNICPGKQLSVSHTVTKKEIFYASCVEFLGFVFSSTRRKNTIDLSCTLSTLINSSISSSDLVDDRKRFDLLALVKISRHNQGLSKMIILVLVETLIERIKINHGNGIDTSFVARTLSTLVLNGGNHAREIWQASCPNLFKCIFESAHDDYDKDTMIDVTKQLSECFSLSGYDTRLLIVKFVSPIIPPLTNIDLERLVLSIPLLASSLVEPSSFVVEKELNEELSSLLPLLCDFALNDDIDKRTRSSTSLIIHSIILKCIQVEDNLPLIALKKSIFPVLEESSMKNNRETFSNALRLAISVGSAAACKGGRSSGVSDDLLKFLTSLTCTGSGTLPGSDCVVCPKFGREKRASLIAADCFALYFAVSVHGNPFWKQRSTSICLQRLIEAFQNTSPSTLPISPLIALSHISCAVLPSMMSNATFQTIVDLIVRGILHYSIHSEDVHAVDKHFLPVGLAALLKILNLKPESVISKHEDYIVTVLLQIITSKSLSNGYKTGYNTITLLALQCLFILQRHITVSKKSIEGTRIVNTIGMSNLVDHKCRLIRSAAMKVRNEWYIGKDLAQSDTRDV